MKHKFSYNEILEYVKCNNIFSLDPKLKIISISSYFDKSDKVYNGEVFCTVALYDMASKIISINSKLNYEKSLIGLCHELVHAQQHYKKRLGYGWYENRKWIWWNGMPHTKLVDLDLLTLEEYYNLPWEVEAYANEKILVEKLI